jgi:hypothetical protein
VEVAVAVEVAVEVAVAVAVAVLSISLVLSIYSLALGQTMLVRRIHFQSQFQSQFLIV